MKMVALIIYIISKLWYNNFMMPPLLIPEKVSSNFFKINQQTNYK